MKKLNVFLITVLVLLFACGPALAYSYGSANGIRTESDQGKEIDPGGAGGPVSPVPEPTTMLLLGSGLAVLAIGARKRKK